MNFFRSLQVPVNPNYDFEGDPAEQPDYANPVVLSNKLVLHANAVIELTESITKQARKRERLRLELREQERELQTMRRKVLARHPITATAAKNLQLTDAHIWAGLEADGLTDEYLAIEKVIAKKEDEIENTKAEEENLKYTVHTIKLASENITNKLSFVKAEAKFAGLGT